MPVLSGRPSPQQCVVEAKTISTIRTISFIAIHNIRICSLIRIPSHERAISNPGSATTSSIPSRPFCSAFGLQLTKVLFLPCSSWNKLHRSFLWKRTGRMRRSKCSRGHDSFVISSFRSRTSCTLAQVVCLDFLGFPSSARVPSRPTDSTHPDSHPSRSCLRYELLRWARCVVIILSQGLPYYRGSEIYAQGLVGRKVACHLKL